jgi:hypothetical protein
METILNNPLFETIICMLLVFALLSLLASNIIEVVNAYFQERGIMLYDSISGMFNDKSNVNFGQILYDHPAINNLKKDKESLPQYISSAMFASCLIDIISDQGREYEFDKKQHLIVMKPDALDILGRFKKAVTNMRHTPLKMQLLKIF